MKRFFSVWLLIFGCALLLIAQDRQNNTPAAENQPSAPAIHNVPNAVAPASNTGSAPAGVTGAITPPAGPGVIDGNDPLLQPPPLPPGKPSLIGGTVAKIDRVRNDMVVKPYGGNNMKIYFDERSHIYRDGVETTQLGIRKGDRVYVDTLLDGPHVFAKNVRVETQGRTADARGQLLAYDIRDGRIEVRDDLSAQPVTFNVDNNTVIRRRGEAGSTADLMPGAIVSVHFSPESANRGIAREIDIYAAPGSTFTFAGTITHLDMRFGVLALQNEQNNANYEIHFDRRSGDYDSLGVGSHVTVEAVFDGKAYMARNISVTQAKAE